MKHLIYILLTVLFVSSCSKDNDNSAFLPGPGENIPGYDSERVIIPDYVRPEQMKIMSFNIRAVMNEGANYPQRHWNSRKAAMEPLFAKENAGLIGLQEAHLSQVQHIVNVQPRYAWYGLGRNTGLADKDQDEMMAILWDTELLEIGDKGTFWLNETGNVGEYGWGENYVRTAAWAVFRHKKTGKYFFFLNTHLPLETIGQKEAVKLISSKVSSLNTEGYPVVMTGDWNNWSTSEIFAPFAGVYLNARDVAPVTDHTKTMNDWGGKDPSTIDHIWFKNLDVLRYRTSTEGYAGILYVSDHYPICATFEFKD